MSNKILMMKCTARIEWEFAATVDRGSELVTMLSTALSLSDDDLEALFTTAQP